MKRPKQKDPSEYGSYAQYAFRATKAEIKDIQKQMDALYERFNKGRDPKAPMGRKAVKIGDIALEALKIGLSALQKRQKWEFKGE